MRKSDPKPPPAATTRYVLPLVFKAQRDLYSALLLGFQNDCLEHVRLPGLVELLYVALPRRIAAETLAESCRSLVGVVLTPERLWRLSWRLAGNMDSLRAGRSVPAWTQQLYPEWVPLQVRECQRAVTRNGFVLARLACRVLAGAPAPLTVWRDFTSGQCYLAGKIIGFERRCYPLSYPEQLVGMRFEGMMEVGGAEPAFGPIRIKPVLKEHNRSLMRLMFRVKSGRRCPFGNPAAFPCHDCPIGFIRCPAGRHRGDYVAQPCQRCGDPQALFDLDLKSDCCVLCYRAERPWKR